MGITKFGVPVPLPLKRVRQKMPIDGWFYDDIATQLTQA